MRKHPEKLELIANDYLEQSGQKPNFSNRDFFNAILIFQTALMDKTFDNQNFDNMPLEQRCEMSVKCGEDLRKLIHTYTGLDTHETEKFL